jgi:plasmid stability protein
MANLQIKGIQEELYVQLKEIAAAENRSVAQEVLSLIREHLAERGRRRIRTSAEVLLGLSGSWDDDS